MQVKFSKCYPAKKAKKDIPQEVESFDDNVDVMLFRIRSFAKITNTCPSHGKKHKLSVDSPDSQEAEEKKKKTKKLSHIPSIPKTKRKDTTPNFFKYIWHWVIQFFLQSISQNNIDFLFHRKSHSPTYMCQLKALALCQSS